MPSTTAESRNEPQEPSCLEKFSATLDGGLQYFFSRLGRLIAQGPWITIGLSIVLMGLFLIGIGQYEEESRPEKLWSPQDTQASKDFAIVSAEFPRQPRRQNVYAVSRSGDNILADYGVLKDLQKFHQLLYSVSTDATGQNGVRREDVTLRDICTRISTGPNPEDFECQENSILTLFDYNITVILAAEASGTSPADYINQAVASGRYTNAFGQPFSPQAVLGGVTTNDQGKRHIPLHSLPFSRAFSSVIGTAA